MKYRASELIMLEENAVWALEKRNAIDVIFDDDVIESMNGRQVILNWYLWEFHRQYPMPVNSNHSVGSMAVEKGFELRALEQCLFDCMEYHNATEEREKLAHIAFQIQNRIYNTIVTRIQSHVSTTSILDFIEILDHEEVHSSNKQCQELTLPIERAYDKIWLTIATDDALKDNNVSRVARSRLVSKDQVLQCLGPRGFIPDIDSTIIRKPLLTGFVEGHRLLIDGLAESRAAANSLIFSSVSIGDAEFFNRRLQLQCSIISRIHPGDCGSTQTIPFIVRGEDLSRISGKYYVREDGGLGVIRPGSKHLIGQTLQLRTALRCHHPDRYGVCETCFGQLSKSIPKNTNIGYLATIILVAKLSQGLLSAKHLQKSCTIDAFHVVEGDEAYIRADNIVRTTPYKDTVIDEVSSVIKLHERLMGHSVTLKLRPEQAKNLSEIDYTPIEKLTPSTITRLNYVDLIVKENKKEITTTVTVSGGQHMSWLTVDALQYIKRKNWTLSNNGDYLIDLSEWDITLPLFQLPMKHTNMIQFMNKIKSFIISTKVGRNDHTQTLGDYETHERAITEFYQLINSKLSLNLSYLEIIMLATLSQNPEANDFRPPRPIENSSVTPYGKNMAMRSLGAAMAFQYQAYRLVRLESFLVKDRPDSVYDNLLVPMTVNPRD